MHINPQRAAQLVENVARVGERIKAANTAGRNIRLIAVSKLKPATDILALHTSPTPHAHFGENYSQELHEKAALLPRTIHWHFIGALQTNKCKPLAEAIPNLWCVSSVDTNKKADALQKGRKALRERLGKEGGEGEAADVGPLRIMVQVNTSGEEEKSGVAPHLAVSLCRNVLSNCPDLKLAGLMTIGAIARSVATTPENENEDFVQLKRVRADVTKELGWKEDDLELSMGMSSDFESAVRLGSDEVRVGTGIFGERPPRKDAKVKEEAEEGKN
ncbi:hypothetical protein K490DRAFT_43882 [Saccharata proteae CBS 121410]|uniref:Pyridoxal phosphate homeostasis protein n=1 Tax=Saccharata proteae CBS 121410 TaxID=1314787 RepID=A0A9P4HRM4_9PEZI|nr:hypothetical protein K490DRAFT_43882 [Saccharata proteae CBS 121410]